MNAMPLTMPALPPVRAIRGVLLVVASAAISYKAATQVGAGRVLLPFALISGAVGMVAVFRPRLLAIVLLVLGGTVLPVPFFPVEVGGIQTDPAEILVWLLVGVWVVQTVAGARSTSIARPIFLLMASAVVGAIHGLSSGADYQLVQGQFKGYLQYLLVLPLALLYKGRAGKERLEVTVLAVCTAGSVYVVVARIAGFLIPNNDPVEVYTLGVKYASLRVRPALLGILFLGTLLLVGRIYGRGLTWTRAAQLLLFVAVWGVSFNRSSWVALVFSILLLARYRPGARDPIKRLRALVTIGTSVLVAWVLAVSGSLGPTALDLTDRVASAGTTKVFSEGSYTDRSGENQAAIDELSNTPVLGTGLGRSYGKPRAIYDPRRGSFIFRKRDYIHNTVLGAYLHFGLFGLAALFGLAVWVRRQTRSALARERTPDAIRCLAAALALLGLALSSLFQPLLPHRPSILAVVFALALAECPTPLAAAEDGSDRVAARA